jgi:TetR/AcrR family transcriptional regulator
MTTTTEATPGSPVTRMGAEERRALVLEAATEVFGQYGYAGTTTDRVAAAAGVSQPYVVRIFGTKEKLFIAVLNRDLTRLMTAFRAALAADTDRPLALADARIRARSRS